LIGELLEGLPCRWVRGEADLEVTEVTHDSRRAGPGVVFVAIRGAAADGLSFARDALAAGAGAVVVGTGRSGSEELARAARVIEVEDERAALATMSRNLRGRPDERLPVVGVTGTNGKTTTCRILATILEAAGVKTGTLGTVGYLVNGEEIPAERTTPEAPDIHRYLARMVSAGCGACVMEVSSHALDLRRVHGMRFRAAVFTNLTRDHLDYHGDMERYFRAKASLFEGLAPPASAVINTDDVYGRRLVSELASSEKKAWLEPITFGEEAGATIRIADLKARGDGSAISLATPEGAVALRTSLVGRPNAYNVTAAAAAARAMGISWDVIARGAAAATRVPGRMEEVGEGDPRVIVDYAHTDDALRSLLETVRQVAPGRIVLVFGCGGDRDRTKRPLMGAHAARLADRVYVTSDNPRGEKPEAIIEEILAGVEQVPEGRSRCRVEPDRAKAIESAIRDAEPADTVVIAGKGHETYQILGDVVRPFDDREVARAALEARRRTGPPRGRPDERKGADGSG